MIEIQALWTESDLIRWGTRARPGAAKGRCFLPAPGALPTNIA
jgi:hypothetical protein